MKAKTVRKRVIGTRLTEAEFQRVSAAAASQDLSESDWVRVLIQAATSPNPTVQLLVEEILAVRWIVQNIVAYLVEGKLITKEILEQCCATADRNKKDRARAVFGLSSRGRR
jgi:hypothetical protein